MRIRSANLFLSLNSSLKRWIIEVRQQPFRRFLPILGMGATFFVFEFLLIMPERWFLLLLLEVLIVLLTSILLTNIRLLVPGWWHTFFTPIMLTTGAGALLLFLSSSIGRQGVIFTTFVLGFLFWENVWRYYWAQDRYHDESLENTSLALNTVALWFIGAFFFHLLLDPTILPATVAVNILSILTLAILVIVFLLDYRTIWVQRYPADRVWLLLVSQSLIVSQLFWVVNFLPHRVEVKTFIVVLAYYLYTNLGRSYLDGTLQSIVLRRYVYVAVVALLGVLLTAEWFI